MVFFNFNGIQYSSDECMVLILSLHPTSFLGMFTSPPHNVTSYILVRLKFIGVLHFYPLSIRLTFERKIFP